MEEDYYFFIWKKDYGIDLLLPEQIEYSFPKEELGVNPLQMAYQALCFVFFLLLLFFRAAPKACRDSQARS